MVLTNHCNFNCPYCRHIGEQISLLDAVNTINMWANEDLKNIRFSGGEPTFYTGLDQLVMCCTARGIERIALSTNGSADIKYYEYLIDLGVNDLSISLDACCASDGEKMTGRKGVFEKIVENIRILSKLTYVTVGVVLTEDNIQRTEDIIKFAEDLGVSDIRVIPAAQNGRSLKKMNLSLETLEKYPILQYRYNNFLNDRRVRGLESCDSKKCGLVLDDMAVTGDKHYPCIIYMREGGVPIGKVGHHMRQEREAWYMSHNTHEDKICLNNCLDVCVDYNNTFERFHL
jgi:molybdenum cofactor biosynthesis enzyme MoaA